MTFTLEWYHVVLALSAIAATVLSWRTPRAVFWVACLVASFVASVTYHYVPKPWFPGMWWPLPSGVTALCDSAIVVLILTFGREQWEVGRFRESGESRVLGFLVGSGRVLGSLRGIMFLSVGLSVMQTSAYTLEYPPVMPHWIYSSFLETINLVALLMIGGVGLLDRINDSPRLPVRRTARHRLGRIGELAHRETWQTPPLSRW